MAFFALFRIRRITIMVIENIPDTKLMVMRQTIDFTPFFEKIRIGVYLKKPHRAMVQAIF